MTPTIPGAPPPADSTPDRLDIPTGDPLLRRLFPPLPSGVRWGLERTRAALAELGDPHLAYPTIHVGGTNGKGSVAATIHTVLDAESGPGALRSGLYTSPHLCSLTERFRIGASPVGVEALVGHADDVRDAVVRHGLTFFEALTVLGFHLFRVEGVDVVVAEVGLGGRLDATNVVDPVATAVTNVAMDHADYLGETLEAIAREKAGIVKAGVPLSTAENDRAILGILGDAARSLGAPLHVVDPTADVGSVAVDADRTTFTLASRRWGELRLTTPLVGRHQAVNTALAVEVLSHLPDGLRPSPEEVVAGVASVRWPGRDQVERVDGVTWILDVAHNVAGVESLADTVDRLDPPRPRVALLGVLGDKAWKTMLPPLLERVDRAILTVPPSAPAGRRWDPVEVARELSSSGLAPCPLEVEERFDEAFHATRTGAAGGTGIVTGSAHTVGAGLAALGRIPGERG